MPDGQGQGTSGFAGLPWHRQPTGITPGYSSPLWFTCSVCGAEMRGANPWIHKPDCTAPVTVFGQKSGTPTEAGAPQAEGSSSNEAPVAKNSSAPVGQKSAEHAKPGLSDHHTDDWAGEGGI